MNKLAACLMLAAAPLMLVARPSSGQAGPGDRPGLSQVGLDRFAETLGYRLTVLSNHPGCPDGTPGCFAVDVAITMPDRLPDGLDTAGTEIRFGFGNLILEARSDTFAVHLVNGDLQALALRPGARLAAGGTYHVQLIGDGHWFSAYHAMPNAYVAAKGLRGHVIAATRPHLDPETGLETLPFVAPFTDEAQLATHLPEDATQWLTPERAFALYAARGTADTPDIAILPTPRHATRPAGDPVDLSRGIHAAVTGVDRSALAPAFAALSAAGAGTGPVPVAIVVGDTAGPGAESYRLAIGQGGVRIAASDAAGASYALRSLAQQVARDHGRLRPLLVEDAPRLPFRGLHVDLGRNFHSRDEILKLLEQMATYKLNKLHLHLGDDEGWRLEVPALPELTEVGAFRCLDDSERTCLLPQLGANPAPGAATNGFLTQADYLQILHAAKERQIEVIPSFDMPGHSRAAIRSMEVRYRRLMAAGQPAAAARFRLVETGDTTRYRSIQNYDDNTLNVCLESTYRFLDTVIDAIAALHRETGVPLKTYHIGADETAGAWSQSPACRAVMAKTGQQPAQLGAAFVERVAADLARRGIKVAGWSDGLSQTTPKRMPARVQTNIWGGIFTGGVTEAHDQLNRGWDVVLSMPDTTYLDMPYAPDPMERGYDWATRGNDSFKSFAFMPENLPANAALMTDILSQRATVADTVPIKDGRHIMGLQAQIWSETVRSDAQVDYMLFPRLIALAERAWHRADWEPVYAPGASYAAGDKRIDRAALDRDWRGFAGRVGAQLATLDRAGVAYRLAPPGARIVAGKLEANTEYPGETIEYRQAAGGWQPYRKPVAVAGPVAVRTRSPDGRRAGRTVDVKGPQ